jgi:maltooligosyltrehalose trehalohydrolase
MRVWAPRARRVEVELLEQDRRVALAQAGPGVFVGEVPIEGPYYLRLDGERMPDPWAGDVESVLGPCRVDHGEFAWTDGGFAPPPLAEAVIYELHVGCYTPAGTFDAAARALPELVELGVTHVELMPVATFSGGRNWGYDGAALFAPHRAYGGPAGLRRLVDRAHALGLAVILDVVYNHVGPIGNFLPRFGPFLHDAHESGWGACLNFDGPESDEVRRFVVDNAEHWLRSYHLDGLRLDAVHAIHDGSAAHVLEELRAMAERVGGAQGKRLVLIAESDLNDPRLIADPARGGFGLDASWCDDFHHALHVALTGEAQGYYLDFADAPLAHLATALEAGYVYAGQYSRYRRRRHGRALGTIPRTRLIGYAQTHDQVGNRGWGERLSQLAGQDAQRLATTLVMTAPFVPMLFMGEEWGASTPFLFFTDHDDEAIAEATRRGRRRDLEQLGWTIIDDLDPQAPEAFVRSRLARPERSRPAHAATLAHARALIALRRAEPALRDGAPAATRVRVDEQARTLVVERGPFRVLCNFSYERRHIACSGEVVVAHAEVHTMAGGFELAPISAVVTRVSP